MVVENFVDGLKINQLFDTTRARNTDYKLFQIHDVHVVPVRNDQRDRIYHSNEFVDKGG